jgi:AAA domain
MKLKPAIELTAPALEWLWPGYLATGNLAILDGDPGLGKSLITLDLAARVTTGRPWPDGMPNPSGPASALLLCDEDVDSVVLARLKTADADLSRAFIWPRLTDGGLPRLPLENNRLELAVQQTGAKLVIIDPIMAFLDNKVEVNTDANVRRALRPLANLAEARQSVILLVRHLNKKVGPQALYRGGGSIAFVAACRLAWLAGRDPHSDGRFTLAQPKNNFAPKQPSLAYTLPKDAARVEWHGPSLWSADDLTARPRPRPESLRAGEFLRAFLADGPRTSRDIWPAAQSQGFAAITIRRARKELRIRFRLVTDAGKRLSYWCLPGQEVPGYPSEAPELDAMLRELEEKYATTPLDSDDDQADARATDMVDAQDDAG